MLVCLRTRPALARPRCVWVFPVSNNNVMSILLNRYVAADDSFQAAVLGAQQKCAVAVQRFGGAANRAIADVNDYILAKRRAMLLPFIGDGLKLPRAYAIIIAVQLLENFNREP